MKKQFSAKTEVWCRGLPKGARVSESYEDHCRRIIGNGWYADVRYNRKTSKFIATCFVDRVGIATAGGSFPTIAEACQDSLIRTQDIHRESFDKAMRQLRRDT